MTWRALTPAEKRAYRAGGFRLEGSARSEEEAARDHLAIARRLLRGWGADAAAVRATLAAPSATTLARWQKGERPIPAATCERIAVVLALYRRCFEAGDIVTVHPLPALRRPGRKALPANRVLAGGKLSDLLALWRQMALSEEASGQQNLAGPRQP